MIFNNNNLLVIDTLLYNPTSPGRLSKIETGKDLNLNHLKVNNNTDIDLGEGLESISLKDKSGNSKPSKEIYKYLYDWEADTILNAFFARNLEAGNISGYGEDIEKLLIKRMSYLDDYKVYTNIGLIDYYDDGREVFFRDPYIESGIPYFYSILPIAKGGTFGGVQKRHPAINAYQYSWLIDSSGVQIQFIDEKITAINYNNKDGVVETMGREMPYVDRFSGADYRTFSINGTISSEFDQYKHIIEEINKDESAYGADINREIETAFQRKFGRGEHDIKNSQRLYSYEKKFRDKITSLLRNGKMKLFKSPTEGMIAVKLTNVEITPIEELGRTLYRFSANATEVAEVDEKLIAMIREREEESINELFNE